MTSKLDILNSKKEEAVKGGGEKRIESQHGKGKLTARERVQLLLDEDSFEEIGMLTTHRSTNFGLEKQKFLGCLLYTSPSPRDGLLSRMPSSA